MRAYLHRTVCGYEAGDKSVTVNGRLPRIGVAPVRLGERVLLHVLNASATHSHISSCQVISFEVIALGWLPCARTCERDATLSKPRGRVAAELLRDSRLPGACTLRTPALDYTQFGYPGRSAGLMGPMRCMTSC